MISQKTDPVESRFRLLVVLASLTMFTAMCTDMYLPAFPAVSEALGVQIVDLQFTLTSFMLGMGLGQVVYGPISDRYGRKIPALFGIGLFIISSVLCATADSLPLLIVYRFFQAFGGAAGIVIARAIVRDKLSGIEMSKMMSSMGMIFVLAPALAPSIGALILHWGSWHWIFIALTFFGICVFLGATSISESLPPERRNDHGFQKAGKAYIAIIRNREFRSASLMAMGTSFVTFSYVSSSPAVLMGSYGVSRNAFGFLYAAISLGLISSSRINIWLIHRFGIHNMLRGFTGVLAATTALVLVACILRAPLWLLMILVVVCFGCAPGIGGNAMTIALTPFPHNAASAAAVLGLLQMLAMAFSSALLSAIHLNVAIKMGVAMFVGALVVFFQSRRVRSLNAREKEISVVGTE